MFDCEPLYFMLDTLIIKAFSTCLADKKATMIKIWWIYELVLFFSAFLDFQICVLGVRKLHPCKDKLIINV